MTTAKKILDELMTLVRSIEQGAPIDVQDAYCTKIKAGITQLLELSKDQPGRTYIREKLSDLEQYVAAISERQDGSRQTKRLNCNRAIVALNTLSGLGIGEAAAPQKREDK
jgi:hypothetical protein